MWEEIFNFIASVVLSVAYLIFVTIVFVPITICAILWAIIFGVRLF